MIVISTIIKANAQTLGFSKAFNKAQDTSYINSHSFSPILYNTNNTLTYCYSTSDSNYFSKNYWTRLDLFGNIIAQKEESIANAKVYYNQEYCVTIQSPQK